MTMKKKMTMSRRQKKRIVSILSLLAICSVGQSFQNPTAFVGAATATPHGIRTLFGYRGGSTGTSSSSSTSSVIATNPMNDSRTRLGIFRDDDGECFGPCDPQSNEGGTQTATIEAPASAAVATAEVGEYKWPENMYVEMKDMASASFLIYAFAYIIDVARKEGLKGVNVASDGTVSLPSKDLPRSFTPEEVIEIIQNNRDVLAKSFDFQFDVEKEYERLIENLKTLQERDQLVGGKLTVDEFDDKHQQNELVYGVTKDDYNKRITLVFRGTEAALALRSNWMTNLRMVKARAQIPDCLLSTQDGGLGGDEAVVPYMFCHSGFLRYVFQKTKDETDDTEFRKYDEIVQDVTTLLKQNPGYKLYVTGHSLGGALATLTSFYLACDENIPRPVTCYNFASPRLGDDNFRVATRWLEKKGWLRVCRVANDNDLITTGPFINYHHVGMNVQLSRNANEEPFVDYPKEQSDDTSLTRMWRNSFFRNFNVRNDHMEYRERVDLHQDHLTTLDLNQLYNDTSLTGY